MRVPGFSKYILCAAAVGAAGYFIGRQNLESAPPAGPLTKALASTREAVPDKDKASPRSVAKRTLRAWEAAAAAIDGRGPFTARLEQALRLDEPFSLARAIDLMGEMSPEDAPAVFELLKAHPDWSPRPVWVAFWTSWGASDPEAALAAVDRGVPSYQLSDRAEKEIFLSLAQQDLERAARLALQRVRANHNTWGVEGVILRWAETDAAGATQWALKELEGADQAWAFKMMPFTLHARQGMAETVRWWQGLPESGGVASAFNTMVEIASQSSTVTPEDRVAILTAGQARGTRSGSLEQQVASDFAKTDPQVGLKLFTSLPPIPNGSYPGVGNLVHQWAARDPAAAGAWLQNQIGKPWAADAIKQFASATKAVDPGAAAEWKSLLSNGKQK